MKIVDVHPVIFRGYDIRGVVDSQLNDDVMYTLGRGYATYLSQRRIKTATIGYDNRLTSVAYAKAFIAGLNDGGVDTINLGLSLSQIVYFSAYAFFTKGYAMISASHNPKEYNGMKLGTRYSETMVTNEVQDFRKLVASKKFSIGHGKNTQIDILPAYTKQLLSHFQLKKKWKVVVEGCNDTAGYFYPDIFRAAGCEVVEQHTTLDGNYPLGIPDPTEAKVLKRLAEGVVKAKADIGFAYDPDGDRMSAVDEKGNVLWMDTIVSLFAIDILDFIPGAKIVYNTLCSKQVTEVIQAHGGEPVMWLTGHSFISEKMKQIHAPFGGELSGHIFFGDNYFEHEDAAYASLRLLQYLERTKQTLSEAVSKLPQYVSSPEIKLGLADDIKFKFIDTEITAAFKKQWPSAAYIEIDGIRMDTEHEMAIIRASQNGPYITVKFEGKTQEQYDTVKHILKKMLSQYAQIDWSKGVNTNALD